MATRLLTEENLELGANNAHLESCVTFFKDAHVFVARRSEAFLSELGRHNYVTPTSYLELLATYKQVLALKRDEVGTLKNRLRVGLDKLLATAEQAPTGADAQQQQHSQPHLCAASGPPIEAAWAGTDAEQLVGALSAHSDARSSIHETARRDGMQSQSTAAAHEHKSE